MPAPKKGPRLGSNPSHQRLMLSNLAMSLFEHDRVKTTEAKAKMLRPFAEKLITRAKSGTVHDRRRVLSVIENRGIVHRLFADIGPRFGERNGGYTRILKLGPRHGDGAPMAVIELVEGAAAHVEEEPTQTKRRRGVRRRRAPEAEPEPPAGRRRAPAGEAEAPGAGNETTGPEDEGSEEDRPS